MALVGDRRQWLHERGVAFGQADRAVHVPPDGGASYVLVREICTVKLGCAQTDGELTALLLTFFTGGGSSVHSFWAERLYYVTAGELTFRGWRDGASVELVARSGTWVHVPAAAPLQVVNQHGRTATCLLLCRPGGLEGWVAGVGEPTATELLASAPRSQVSPDTYATVTRAFELRLYASMIDAANGGAPPPISWSLPGEGERYRVVTDDITIRTGLSDACSCAVIDVVQRPATGAPPYAVPSDRLFYIVKGELRLDSPGLPGGRELTRPGSVIYLPAGVPAGDRARSPYPCRFIGVLTGPPGADLFRAWGVPLTGAEPPLAPFVVPSPEQQREMIARAEALGVTFLEPPGRG